MRDVFLLAILPFLLYAMAMRPFIALGLWVWTALFFPNAWVYGPAGAIRYNLLIAGFTIGGWLLSKQKARLYLTTTGWLVLVFFAWTTVSSFLQIGDPIATWDYWNRFLKIVILFVFVLLIVERKLHIDFMLWCIVLSIGFYGNLEALKFVASGGGHMIEGLPGHVLGDRNDLAVAFVMTLPICYYLMTEYGDKSRIIWFGLVCTMGLLVLGVIGTQSRGGFISLLVLGAYFFIKSDRKIMLSLAIVVLVVIAAQLASSEWLSRIDSIDSANQDASFMGRVVAWKLSFILACEHPMFGGGFRALESYPVWMELSQQFHSFPWFYTGDAVPDVRRSHAAHSAYFQVMGDHGFGGLILYLSILLTSFLRSRRIHKVASRTGMPSWIKNLNTMLQLSLFAFCVGSAALSFAYFDLSFALIALLIVIEKRMMGTITPEKEGRMTATSVMRQEN